MIYFLWAIPIYIMAASLPLFLAENKLNYSYYYALGFILAGIGACLWLTLAKGLNASQISLWGLKWDVMITVCYVLTPMMFVRQELTTQNIIGMVFAFVGIILLKV